MKAAFAGSARSGDWGGDAGRKREPHPEGRWPLVEVPVQGAPQGCRSAAMHAVGSERYQLAFPSGSNNVGSPYQLV